MSELPVGKSRKSHKGASCNKKSVSLWCKTGEMVLQIYKVRFYFYPKERNRQFQEHSGDKGTWRSSVLFIYPSSMQCLYVLYGWLIYMYGVGLLFFLISELAFGDACFLNGENKSPRLFYIINNAEFGGLISNIKV